MAQTKTQQAIAAIEGGSKLKGAVQSLGGEGIIPSNLKVIPTGSLGLDIALGVWGMPRGRIIEIYGPEASGKTTLALSILASCQNMFPNEPPPAIIDAEHALSSDYAAKLGIDLNNCLINQPDSGEEALNLAQSMTENAKIPAILIDSVSALVPQAELDGEMGDSHMGLQARMMSQAMRKLAGAVSRNGTTLIFINQIREKIGVMFGSPETTSGGRALKFAASVRIDIRRIGGVKSDVAGEADLGNLVRAKVVKNKLAPPFREAEFPIIFGHGIGQEVETVTLGVKWGVLELGGSWFKFDNKRLANGRQAIEKLLREDPQYVDGIQQAIIQKVKAYRNG